MENLSVDAVVQSFADALGYEQVSSVIVLGSALVYKNKLVALIIFDKTAGGIYGKRCAADDKNIAVFDSLDSAVNSVLVKALLIKHHIGLDKTAALCALRDKGRIFYVLSIKHSTAADAVIAVYRAVKLIHGLAARSLMKAVDVLGDNCFELASSFKLRKSKVSFVGLSVKIEHLVLIELIELTYVIAEKGTAQNSLRGLFIFHVINSVHASEIRNTAFRGNTCSAEKDNIIR